MQKQSSGRLPDVFCRKEVFNKFSKFTGKHLCQSLFFNKVAGLRSVTLLKRNSFSFSFFPANFTNFLRTPFYKTPPMAASGNE